MSKVKDLPKFLRPREKLLEKGPNALKDYELLAILLRTGTKDLGVLELSKKVLRKYKKVGINNLDINELQKNFGIGPAKACEIMASFEFVERIVKGKKTKLIMSPKDVFDEMKDIRDNKKEHLVVFFLDVRNQEIRREIISVGTLNSTLIHPREVYETAIKNYADHLIVAHNHPSGVVEPSKEDQLITENLVRSGKILGIDLIDHIIVSKDSYFSFKEKGIL